MKMIMSTLMAIGVIASTASAHFNPFDDKRLPLPHWSGYEQALPRTSDDKFRDVLPRAGNDDFRQALPLSEPSLDNVTAAP